MKDLFVAYTGIKNGIEYSRNIIIDRNLGTIKNENDVRTLEQYIQETTDFTEVSIDNFRRME